MSDGSERRQRWLQVILPGLMIGVGYGVFVGLPAEQALRGRSTPNAAAATTARNKSAAERKQLAALQLQLQELRAQRSSAIGPFAGRAATRLGGLAGLFRKHGMELVKEGPARGVPIEPALEQLARWREASQQRPTLWAIELRGGYLGMLAALKAIGQREDLVTVRLELEQAPVDQRTRTWKLVLWG